MQFCCGQDAPHQLIQSFIVCFLFVFCLFICVVSLYLHVMFVVCNLYLYSGALLLWSRCSTPIRCRNDATPSQVSCPWCSSPVRTLYIMGVDMKYEMKDILIQSWKTENNKSTISPRSINIQGPSGPSPFPASQT